MNTVSIIGTGTMGRGIAQTVALAGFEVILYDVAEEILTAAILKIQQSIDIGVQRGKTAVQKADRAKCALQTTTSLAEAAKAEFIIEAAPEELALKHAIFKTLDESAPKKTIFASNTSSLSINSLSGATKRPDRFIGLHFFNPAHIMKLVEIIANDFTSDQTMAAAKEFAVLLGKTAVCCKDTPGFIVNRVARPFYGEAFRLLGEGVTDFMTIDKLIKSLGFRMGPFELVDLVGCDVNLMVTQSVYDATFHDPKYRPHPIQKRMVESGRLGRKSGQGFYNYDG
jgi:3-hydroxybutyryl-CoA dehydrogenase